MSNCLNPKKPHENNDVPAQASPAAPGAAAAAHVSVSVNAQITCQFCKYLLEGAVLGDCRVTRWIGSGAFGDVYEATQLPPLSRRVAIKVMLSERVADEDSAALFEREVSAIAALDHPNILPVLRAGILEDGRAYLVMKYAAHGSLQQYCQLTPQGLSILPTSLPVSAEIETRMMNVDEGDKSSAGDRDLSSDTIIMTNAEDSSQHDQEKSQDRGSESLPGIIPRLIPAGQVLTPQQLLPYIEDAAAALQYAHDHSLIHLDVKPANLLLDAEDRLLLADFGVSTILDGYSHASLHCYVGTPVYTAPEQWLEQPRPASDQYALAITCYQLLTGRPPFTGNLYSIMHGHLQLPPPPLRDSNPLVPEQVEEVILRALAKEPADRYKDMRAFARTYRDALEQAAGASTDVKDLGRQASLPSLREPALTDSPAVIASGVEDDTPPGDATGAAAQGEARSFKQTAPLTGKAAAVTQGDKLPTSPARKKRGRLVAAVVLAALLVFGGALGAIRAFTPCLLGACPALRLSASEVDITNSDTQVVRITDSGTAGMQWSVTNPTGAPWLTYAPQGGALSPGQAASLTIKTNAQGLPNGVNTTQLEITGQGVSSPLTLVVKLTVQGGLSQIAAKASATIFVSDQSGIHPASGSITITNKSDQSFSWFIEYRDFNNWLQVSPPLDTLAPGGAETLTVTANPQGLPPDTYTADFSILGSLDQSDPGVLSSFQFTLAVKPSAQQATPTVTAIATTPVTQTFPPITFSAQAPAASNVPSTLRSGHSMVWDAQDDLLFVFGGLDSQGNLLDDFWSYSPVTDQWSQITNPSAGPGAGTCPGGTWPAARMDAAMVWDSVHAQILLYGGVGAQSHDLGDLWSYSPSAGAGNWTPLACSNAGPGARASNAVWNGSQLLLLGGMSRFGLLADFWAYTPASNGGLGSWQRLADFPGGQRAFQTMVWDASDNLLFAFGGLDVNALQRDDFYSYSANAGWNQVTPSSAANPRPRQQGIGAWDSKDHVMLMIGGWNDKDTGGPYYGLWAYDPAVNQWALLTPLNSSNTNIIPGRTASAMVWDAREQAAYIYAGAGSGKTGSTLNDLWMVTSA
jgi:serine/threonine protein kinase